MKNLRWILAAWICVFGMAQGRVADFPVKGVSIQVPDNRREAFYSLASFTTGIMLPQQLDRLGKLDSLLNANEHSASYLSEEGEKTTWHLRRVSQDGFLVLNHTTSWGETGSMKSEIKLKVLDAKLGTKRVVTVIPIAYTLQSTTYRDADVMARLEKMMGKELFTIEIEPSDSRSTEGIVALSFIRASTLTPQRFCE